MHNNISLATIVDILQQRVAETPDDPLYTFLSNKMEKQTLTYRQLDERARQIAARLQQVTNKDDRVLICHLPGLDYIAAFYGCLYAGVIAVPIYPPQYHKGLDRVYSIVKDVKPKAALTSGTILKKAKLALWLNQNLRQIKWIASDQIQAKDAAASDWSRPEIDSESLAFLQYTSGSTSQPKGVKLSHGNLITNLVAIQHKFGCTKETIGSVWLPPYHDMGLIGGILQPMFVGFPIYLMSPMTFILHPITWLRSISEFKATISGGPNFGYDLCAARISEEETDKLDLRSWELAFCGAEPIRNESLDTFLKKFGRCGFSKKVFYPCYGLAEGTLIVTGGEKNAEPICRLTDLKSLEENKVSPPMPDSPAKILIGCGTSINNQQVVIANPENKVACPDGQIGEIWVNGPCIAKGYWQNPQATHETFEARLSDGRGPFLRTGDLGFIENGELYVTGRLKDMIIVKGRNYYPHDIEYSYFKCHEGLKPGYAVAFAVEEDNEEKLVVIQEVRKKADRETIRMAIPIMQKRIAEHFDLVAHDLVLVESGNISRTSSGKLQRLLTKKRYQQSDLNVVYSLHHWRQENRAQ